MNLRWVEEVGPQPQSDSEWLRDNFCLSSHYLYVNGMSPVGEPIETKEHLQRGKSLDNLTKMWLFTWGQNDTD